MCWNYMWKFMIIIMVIIIIIINKDDKEIIDYSGSY